MVLIISQIVFHFAISLATLVVGVFLSFVLYELFSMTRELGEMVRDVRSLSHEAEEKIHSIIERLEEFPIVSFLFGRKRGRSEKTKKTKKN